MSWLVIIGAAPAGHTGPCSEPAALPAPTPTPSDQLPALLRTHHARRNTCARPSGRSRGPSARPRSSSPSMRGSACERPTHALGESALLSWQSYGAPPTQAAYAATESSRMPPLPTPSLQADCRRHGPAARPGHDWRWGPLLLPARTRHRWPCPSSAGFVHCPAALPPAGLIVPATLVGALAFNDKTLTLSEQQSLQQYLISSSLIVCGLTTFIQARRCQGTPVPWSG